MTAMTSEKSERLLNLLIMLLVQRQYVGKERIRRLLYADSTPDAFEKMFERDKEELRSLGVPIEVGTADKYFDDEVGYRVLPDSFALPAIELRPDEAAVVGLATRVWEHATLAKATTEAVRKLAAAGLDVDPSALDIAQPRLAADEPAFEVFWQAVCERVPLRFDYRRPGEQQATTRHLQPWGVTRYGGRWYAVGHDTDRDGERVFRLSRVEGKVHADGPAGSYEVPDSVDPREVARRLAPGRSSEPAVLLVRSGAAWPLRRAADEVHPGVAGPDGSTDWDRLVLTSRPVGLAEEVLGFGADVVVVEPVGVRAEVVERLRGLGAAPASTGELAGGRP
ncbi:helix-turn-helix transcriptional regulator [Nocardioides nanhaiensis]|uniref:YafY family protein n=1 Tax=Nocardioides nanhaiensis TaxID=1476871 RepID=A0ABP8WQ95_9ACTN